MASFVEGGKRRRRAVYGGTKREATDKLKVVQRSVSDGLVVTRERLAVGAYLDRWMRESVVPSVRPRTADSYGELIRNHITPSAGSSCRA